MSGSGVPGQAVCPAGKVEASQMLLLAAVQLAIGPVPPSGLLQFHVTDEPGVAGNVGVADAVPRAQ